MLPLATASCLITDRQQIEVVDYPPSIGPSISAMIVPNRVRVIPLDAIGALDGGLSELTFDLVVRDPNLTQPLRVRTIVNASASAPSPMFAEQFAPLTGSVERPVTGTVQLSDLSTTAGCNKVEFWVSSNFAGSRTSVDPNDIASITYWIAISDGTTPVDMTRCP